MTSKNQALLFFEFLSQIR